MHSFHNLKKNAYCSFVVHQTLHWRKVTMKHVVESWHGTLSRNSSADTWINFLEGVINFMFLRLVDYSWKLKPQTVSWTSLICDPVLNRKFRFINLCNYIATKVKTTKILQTWILCIFVKIHTCKIANYTLSVSIIQYLTGTTYSTNLFKFFCEHVFI